MSLVNVRSVEILMLAGRADDDEVVGEGAEVTLKPQPKVPAVGAKLERNRIVARQRALRPQVIAMNLVRAVGQGLVVPDVLVQSARCNR